MKSRFTLRIQGIRLTLAADLDSHECMESQIDRTGGRFGSFLFLSAAVATMSLLASGTSRAQTVIGVDGGFNTPGNAGIIFDLSANGSASNARNVAYASIRSVARDPATNVYWVALQSGNQIGTLDPANGATTAPVAVNPAPGTAAPLSGITVGPNSQIYGVIGKQAGGAHWVPGDIVTVNPTTGALGFVVTGTDTGDGGHSLEYNPADGLLYHFYNNGGVNAAYEPINAGTLTVGTTVDLPINGASVIAAVHHTSGQFFIVDNDHNAQGFYNLVGATGALTPLGTTTGSIAALEMASSSSSSNAAAKAALRKKCKKISAKVRMAKKRGQRPKARRLVKKLRKCKKKLAALG